MFKLSLLFFISLVGCGRYQDTTTSECFAPLGEYIARPALEMNNCVLFDNLPTVMFLNTEDLDEQYLVCGDHLMLDGTFESNSCIKHQQKYLTTSKEGFDGSLFLETNCKDFTCVSYWSLEFRRLEERNQ